MEATCSGPDTPKYLFPKNLPKSRFLFGAAELKAGMFGPAPKVGAHSHHDFCLSTDNFRIAGRSFPNPVSARFYATGELIRIYL